jgi:uncharacterized protein (TIGR02246 family)
MDNEERAIRELIATWMRATAHGDLQTLLTLMAEDVVFLVPGQPPMGRDAFVAGFEASVRQVQITATSDIQEIEVIGDRAWCWNRLNVAVTPRAGGTPKHRSGFTLSVLRKEADGRWVLARDATLLA